MPAANHNANSHLINCLYGFLSDPDSFEHLFESLNARYQDKIDFDLSNADVFDASNDAFDLGEVEHHFKLAARIFDRMPLLKETVTNEGTDGLAAAHPMVLLKDCGSIAESNKEAREELGFLVGQNINDLSTNSENSRTLKDEVQRLAKLPMSDIIIVLIHNYAESQDRRLYTLSRFQKPGTAISMQLQSVMLGWDGGIGQKLCYSFGLTASEQEILKGIVEGLDLASVARFRGRSLQTIRTQAKSLLRKTGAKSQAGLIRMFAAISLSQVSKEDALSGREDKAGFHTDMVDLPDGRKLQVDTWNTNGKIPVVLLHGLFSGTGLTQKAMALAAKKGFAIYAPWRPGWAKSSARKMADASPEAFAEDISVMLNHYGIRKAVLLGRYTGAVYAVAAAQKLEKRIAASIFLSMTLPVQNVSQLNDMSGWQRVFAYSITYCPHAIPILVRGMWQFVFRKNTRDFMERFYLSPDEDIQARSDANVIKVIEDGVRQSFMQDTAGHEHDMKITVSDWSGYLDDIKSPTLLIHGEKDPNTPLNQIQELVSLKPKLDLLELKNQGQLYVHSRPDLVFEAMENYLTRGDIQF